ncbi:MAG TPA: acetyl-CoA hydrolase/transferase C-terminal domain-containing protein [Burkholderiales bacterium]|nr:acetyl-CoA hydrolase/transferase C-terminal domain-containing protein [Burkholderiales bacterium]
MSSVELDPAALDLARFIRPGDSVVVAQASSEPLTLTEALVAQADRLGAITIFIGASWSDTFAPDRAPSFRYVSYGALGTNARLARAGRLDIVPCHYSQLCWLFESGASRPDVVLLALSPVIGGTMTLGASHGYALAAARRARTVIAEVNERMPWVHGGEVPADLRIDAIVRTSRPLPTYPASRIGAVERKVAARVAALVPDGATVQLGVGTLPDAVLEALAGHRDLGIHSGMLTRAVLPLLESGAVTNSRKPIDAGVTVTGLLIGDEKLYAHAHRNAALRLAAPDYTHSTAALARLPDFVSVNSAIEVDLFGRVNAEVAGGDYVGGVGGAMDFIRGAAAAPGGRAVIALPSVSRDGKASRIVASCATVTTPAAEADLVATEWGVASLRGVTYAERAQRLVAIAHPDHRAALTGAARKLP